MGSCISLLLIPELNSRVAYQLNSRFSILLDAERIGDIQATLSVLQQEECLVWSLCGASFLCSQDDAQCIGTGEYNGFGQGLRGSEPNCNHMLAPVFIVEMFQQFQWVLTVP
jgi:hypothetical protein